MEFCGTSKATTWHFRGDARCMWANLTISEETGEVTLHSDVGTFGHRWPVQHIGCESMAEFFATAHRGYILDKFSYDCADLKPRPDAEKTLENLREAICQARRELEIDRELARELWEVAAEFTDGFDHAGSDASVMMAIEDADHDLQEFACDAGGLGEYISNSPSPTHQALYERVLPPIQERLRTTLTQRHRGEVDGG